MFREAAPFGGRLLADSALDVRALATLWAIFLVVSIDIPSDEPFGLPASLWDEPCLDDSPL